MLLFFFFFFFQAEDGIRDYKVTGVQTCALPISDRAGAPRPRGQPVDHRDAVGELLLRVLVEEYAVRFARPAHVDPDGGVAVAREVVVHRLGPGAAGGGPAVRGVIRDGGPGRTVRR